MKTDTPETDAETWKAGDLRIGSKVCADFARKLERERDELKRWTSVNGVIDLQRERDEAREETIRTREFMDYGFAKAQEELTDMTAQRDGIDSMYQKIIKEVLECDPIPACKREDDHLEPPWEVIARIREQRDRLAAVLQRIRDGYGGQVASPNCCEDCDYLLPIDEALQSLTPKP
jgi:hypothetical protein